VLALEPDHEEHEEQLKMPKQQQTVSPFVRQSQVYSLGFTVLTGERTPKNCAN